jgi:hypothetical protein
MNGRNRPKRPRIKLSPELVKMIKAPLVKTPELEEVVKKDRRMAAEKIRKALTEPDWEDTQEKSLSKQQFNKVSELTAIVKAHKGILFPLSLHWTSFRFEVTFVVEALKGDADSYDITEDTYEFEEVTDVKSGDIDHLNPVERDHLLSGVY